MKYGIDFDIPQDNSKIGEGGTASLFTGELINPQIIASNGSTANVGIFADLSISKIG